MLLKNVVIWMRKARIYLIRSLKRCSTIAAPEHDESEDEKEYKIYEIEKKKESKEESEKSVIDTRRVSPIWVVTTSDHKDNIEQSVNTSVAIPGESSEEKLVIKSEPNSFEEFSNLSIPIPVENGKIKEENFEQIQEAPEEQEENDTNKGSSICSLQVEDLVSGARIMILQDGLLYAGNLSPITPPDVYGIHIDGERGTRPHICCQEELLTQAWKEVKPGSTRFLTEGTRVCAFWSQQYRGLYPGCVAAASSPTHEGNHNLVNVEFDDGDSGRIHVDDIRLLPQNFPITKHDPNPLMTLNKRKRRLTEESVDLKPNKKQRKDQEPLLFESSKENDSSILCSREENVKESSGEKAPRIESKKKKKKRKAQVAGIKSHENRRHKKRRRNLDAVQSNHKHKRKSKRKTPARLFPRVELGDSELRMRIKSPPRIKEEENSSSEESSSEEESRESETNESINPPQRRNKRSPSEKSKMAPFLFEQQLWSWSGKGYKRPGVKGKGKKEFYKEIIRGKEQIKVGDCAVFLSSGSHDRPYIGKITFLWEGWGGNMVVKVQWFYHPDETAPGTERKLSEPKGALFSSSHTDENDVQTISHKCHVVSLADYKVKRAELDRKHGPDYENYDLYYLAGFYDTTHSRILMEPGVS
ncbi:BAH and coiled-coil domain-containing protein 1 [Armadillidium nasatum]|uniref:BAH and coiled-coil domain-containing protein 1 n=1 Tax=Armadillidium nasatum TaxID=96803 RepID=A0A5N5T3T3_9CRUS|nr:BAH and coiled-coil domain-containing protein 1 [Armadillidium nasatum]